ncbi:MAG TPA: DivIVA domain-containing protein [Solirubrobacterales bacterium]
MDQSTGIERIRTATFTLTRRGYDKREVEQFLNKIADWLETGGGDQARADVVRRELERVGQRTVGILATAEDSAEEIRADAEEDAAQTTGKARSEAAATRQAADEYAAKTRDAADAYAAKARKDADEYGARTRQAADGYAGKAREEADEDAAEARQDAEHDARNMVAAAETKATRIVDEGMARRRDIEMVISDLVDRRDGVIEDANRLAAELRRVADGHTPAPGDDRFDEPAELDPSERVGA